MYDYEKDTKQLAEEVKTLLSGYLPNQDTIDYLSYKIARIHEGHVCKIIQNYTDDLKHEIEKQFEEN